MKEECTIVLYLSHHTGQKVRSSSLQSHEREKLNGKMELTRCAFIACRGLQKPSAPCGIIRAFVKKLQLCWKSSRKVLELTKISKSHYVVFQT